MKKILFLLTFVTIFGGSFVFAQTPSSPDNPFRSLEMWFATQSAPEAFEKAQWGLDDINSYRRMMGLLELPEAVLGARVVRYEKDVRERRLFRRALLRRSL